MIKCFSIIFLLYIEVLTGYYQKNKERLSKKARERYQNLSKEEKEKKHQYGRERYKNLLENEYRQNFSRM